MNWIDRDQGLSILYKNLTVAELEKSHSVEMDFVPISKIWSSNERLSRSISFDFFQLSDLNH